MQLLRVPDALLNNVIEKELEKNELLEKEPPGQDTDIPSPGDNQSRPWSGREEPQYPPIEDKPTLHEFLESQLGTLQWEREQDRRIAEHILGSIGPSGYLSRSLQAIQDDILLNEYEEVELDRIESILYKVQQLDPPGIAARNLRECLLIQLDQQLSQEDETQTATDCKELALARTIIGDYFDAYSKKQYQKIEQEIAIDKEALKRADEKIQHLNPKPASGYTSGERKELSYIIPDFIIKNQGENLEVALYNPNLPKLRINEFYSEMLQGIKKQDKVSKKKKEEYTYIKQKVDAARWFIEAIRQRQETLLKTMNAIVHFQRNYFLSGDIQDLRPMIYKDIAALTHLDISTISRVVNSKYVQTEFGTKLLKDFFSEGITTASGEEVSNLEVKQKLRDLVDKENKQRPLSDQKLMTLLNQEGYGIARRTVAKYREQLGIPVARLRKEI